MYSAIICCTHYLKQVKDCTIEKFYNLNRIPKNELKYAGKHIINMFIKDL